MVFCICVEFNDMKRLIVFVFALVIIGSCAKNGEYTEYYSNGEIKHWELYENDFLTHYKYYDTSGNIGSEVKNLLLNSNSVGEYSYAHFQKSYYNGILVSLRESKPRNVDQPFDNEFPDDIIIREAFFDTTGKKQGNWTWMCNNINDVLTHNQLTKHPTFYFYFINFLHYPVGFTQGYYYFLIVQNVVKFQFPFFSVF